MTLPTGAVILAGGLSRRMGGVDKALLPVAGRPLIVHVVDRLRPQVDRIAVNANGAAERFAFLGLPVLPDLIPGHGGPLVGVLTALRWAAAQGLTQVAVAAADTPLLPADLVARFTAATAAGAEVAIATSRGRDHPTVALWSVALAPRLDHALRVEDERRMMAFLNRCAVAMVEWAGTGPCADPFTNVNTPEDARALAHWLEP